MDNIELLSYQYDFIHSEDPNLVLIAGVGTGKTRAIAYYILKRISQYPDSNILVVANTYSQLINSTLEPLFAVLDELGIPYKPSLAKHRLTIFNTTVFAYSLEKYDNIRGIEVGTIIADEFFLFKNDMAYKTIKTRLRDPNVPLQFRGCTTKNGFNWGYGY